MEFLLSAIIFTASCLIFLTLFGVSLISYTKTDFDTYEKTIFGTITGFVFLTLLAYFFFLFKAPLLAPIIAMAFILKTRKNITDYVKGLSKIRPKLKPALLVVFLFSVGIAGQLAVIAPSGINMNGDILFWSAHGHDGMWHITLMEEIKRGGTLQNPVFAGERLVNYHFFSDIVPALFGKYLPLNNLDLYFRLFPFLYSILLGASVYLLVKKMTGKVNPAIWAVFFTYFAGSFGYVATYLRDESFRGESIFWATQIQSSSGNPPQIISNFLVLGYLYFFLRLIKKSDWRLLGIAAFILASLFLFKVYAAIALLAPTLLVGVWQVLRERKIHFLALGILGGALGALLYIPNITLGTSFLIFEPWWYIRTMIVEPGRLDWLDHELRRQTYIYEHNWKRVVFLEAQGFVIFILGNLGMRMLGFWDFFKSTKTSLKNYFNLLLILVIIFSVAFPLTFLQRGVASNTSQSLQYFILLFGILAGLSVSRLIESARNRMVKIAIVAGVVLFSIPTQVGLLNEFYSRAAFAKISKEEVEALEYIKQNTPEDAVVLTPPYDPGLSLKATTPEIWDWFDTGYVSAISSRRTYFDDYEQVDIMGYKFEGRKLEKETVFLEKNENKVKSTLEKITPDIIYIPKQLKPQISPEKFGYLKLFENEKIEVWRK